VGSDREVKADFQLLAGTNRDLGERVAQGRFREDLLARINLWSFRLPGLRERPEDLEPNLLYELDRVGEGLQTRVTMSREARERYVRFATGPEATWPGNFRDLNASVVRLATLARGGRISLQDVDDELLRLRALWASLRPREADPHEGDELVVEALGEEAAAQLDRFDRVQLADVLLVCRQTPTLSAAGRVLFAASRGKKTSQNDADRLRKYLGRFGLDGRALQATKAGGPG
jgi:transcriptional regulatory protein RtcR